jgi:hypothetical protein
MGEAMKVLSEAVDDFKELNERVEKQDRFERERKATRGLPIVHRRNRAIAWEVSTFTTFVDSFVFKVFGEFLILGRQ